MGSRLMKEVLPPRTQLDPHEHWCAFEQERRMRTSIADAIWIVIILLSLVGVLLRCVEIWT